MSPQHMARQAYSQASHTVPKTRQIVMLYDGTIRFMRQAKEAIEENRIEDRFNLLMKTSDIIAGLQSCLDFDNGGEVAQSLYGFYSSIEARVMSINRTNSAAECEAIIEELKEMREVWSNIDRGETSEGTVSAEESGNAEPMAENLAAPSPSKETDFSAYSSNITA